MAIIPADDGALVLQIQPEQFTRAASGLSRFTLENTGAAKIEIVTTAASGAAASPEIAFSLLDLDGNVLAVKPFKQVIGEGLVVLPNINTVARIAAGRIFKTSSCFRKPTPSRPTRSARPISLRLPRAITSAGSQPITTRPQLPASRQYSFPESGSQLIAVSKRIF
jgi:hypothetical protein